MFLFSTLKNYFAERVEGLATQTVIGVSCGNSHSIALTDTGQVHINDEQITQ